MQDGVFGAADVQVGAAGVGGGGQVGGADGGGGVNVDFDVRQVGAAYVVCVAWASQYFSTSTPTKRSSFVGSR